MAVDLGGSGCVGYLAAYLQVVVVVAVVDGVVEVGAPCQPAPGSSLSLGWGYPAAGYLGKLPESH